ncbi:MAG: AAA family ATPase [Candidatus Micrarchaeaceae archaeon]
MGEPYIIRVASQKGGVGKTTVAVNLASCLADFGYSVLLVDCDTTNPSIGFHLGIERSNIGFKELVKGRTKINDLMSTHAATGIKIIPGSINTKPFVLTEAETKKVINIFRGTDFNFIFLDTQPGYYTQNSANLVDETLLLTTPDMPSCASVMRSVKLLDEKSAKHNLLINRIKNKNYEVNTKEIEEMYNGRIIGGLPESDIVPISIAEHIPAYILDQNNKFSKNLFLASRYYKKGAVPENNFEKNKKISLNFWSKLFKRR